MDEGVEKRLDSKVRQGGGEEDRRHLPREEIFPGKGIPRHFEEIELFDKGPHPLLPHPGFRLRRVEGKSVDVGFLRPAYGGFLEEEALPLFPVDHPLKLLARPDRPVHCVGVDLEDVFNLVHQLQRLSAGHVHLVDEGEDGDLSQAADFEEFPRLLFNPFRSVDHHDRAIGCGQSPVGVFGEVLMAWGVEDVDDRLFIGELHGGGGDRDPPLLLHGHPVGGGGLAPLPPLDHPGGVDRPGIEEQFFSQGRFPRIGVADDGKGAPFGNFFLNLSFDVHRPTRIKEKTILSESLR